MNAKPPSNRPQSPFDQLKNILDEDENLRALARIILVLIFLVIVIWLGAFLLPKIQVAVNNLYQRLVTPLETPIPTAFPTPEGTLPTQATPEVTSPPGPQPTTIPIQPPVESPFKRLQEWFKWVRWEYVRLLFAPLIAFGVVLIAGAYFIKDVYALPQLRMGLRYVRSSMFGINYPRLVIDGGKKRLKEGEFNLLDKIGGPGYVVVRPGNAVLFNRLRKPSGVGITRSVFLRRFETIGMIVNLDEQHHHEDQIGPITTQDGIKVMLQDVNYRYRVVSSTPRSLENPYPFDLDAIRKMAANRTVGNSGISTWRQTVNGMIRSALINYINTHTIDFLTAPREGSQDPRQDMRQTLMGERSLQTLRNVGTELLWIDVGHVDILGTEVDEERVNFWAADWVGSAKATRAFGDAKRQAYVEIGRAEAQAEMIMSIAHSLEDLDLKGNSDENIRNLLLARTAQIIDALSSSDESSDGKKPK
jgi:hypothetical protein